MKPVANKKQQRLREYKAKITKLKVLKQKCEEVRIKSNDSDGYVVGGFKPSGHGFNFIGSSITTKDDQAAGGAETSAENDSRKRKLFDEFEKKCDVTSWALPFNKQKADSLQDFDRSIVRATAFKDVKLLKEMLQEKAQDPNNLVAVPTNLFPNYPSSREKYSEELNYALLIAVTSNSCEIVDVLLSAGANVSKFNEWNPLVLNAVDRSFGEMVQILLKHGADPNAFRLQGSGLHSVARKTHGQDFSLATTLIEAGADVNLKNSSEGATPLLEAIKYNNVEAVEFFLNKGADANIADNTLNRTPLHWASSSGNLAIVTLLLDKGANPMVSDNNSQVPWMIAIEKKFYAVAEKLCSFQDVNATDSLGRTPLHIACAAGCVRSVQLLLKEGANFNAVDNAGNTPLIEAAGAKAEVVHLLLQRPFIKIHHRNIEGSAAIHIAINKLANTTPNHNLGVSTCSKAALTVVNLLVGKGADVNMLNGNGGAMVVDHVDKEPIFKYLIAAGANANVITNTGNNVLHQAVLQDLAYENTSATEMVLKMNIDTERLSRTVYNGVSPLQKVLEGQDFELLKLLVNSGADTSALRTWLQSSEGKDQWDSLDDATKSFLNKQTTKGAKPLMEFARSAVLRHLGHKKVNQKIDQLNIPKTLQKFLTHEIYLSWRSEDS